MVDEAVIPDEVLPPPTGEDFGLTNTPVVQVRLDGDTVKAILQNMMIAGYITQATLAGCYKEVKFTQMRTPRRDKDKKKPFVMPSLANATITGLIDMLGTTREEIANAKKLEGIYKTALQARLVESGAIIPDSPGGGGGEDE